MTQVYFNGKIYVERDRFVDAVLVEDGVISKIGTYEEVTEGLCPKCEKELIDLGGKTMIPGFNDSHQHLLNSGRAMSNVRLAGSTKLTDLIERGREFIASRELVPGDVIVGSGWNQDYFTDEARMPTRYDLDKISTEYPIIFSRACGHISVANSKALELAGITRDTEPLPGGVIYHDENGEPNGLTSENAQRQVRKIVPSTSVDTVVRNLKVGMKYAAAYGITSVQPNDIRTADYKIIMEGYDKLYETYPDAIRVYHQSNIPDPVLFREFLESGHQTGAGNDMQKFGPLKLFVDGSLGARTAWMKKPYADDPSTSGVPTMTDEQLDELVQIADSHDTQVAIHAIGDAAIQQVLDAYSKVIEGRNNKNRHAVIHVQVTDQAMLDTFYNKDILAQVQPIFIDYDMNVIYDRVGKELAETSYNFGTLFRMGVHTSYGTDSPVEDMQPFHNLYCAVTRKRLREDKVYLPGERVDIYDAIDQYTIGSAYCSFDEDRKGRIKPGYLADFAVLDRDIFTIPDDEIKDVQCVMTFVGGRKIFER